MPNIYRIINSNNSQTLPWKEPFHEISIILISKPTKDVTRAGCQWFMLVILVTQEAEIRRITVRRDQPGEIVPKTLSQKYPTQKKGLVE
jgi:hypothetical protein